MKTESPFIVHRDKVLGHYSTARWLRQLVLAMWNGSGYTVNLSGLTNLDRDHAGAALAMISSYQVNGENDRAFMALADECRARLEEEQRAEERDKRLESWLSDVRGALHMLDARPGLTDDRYDWFESAFDAGLGADTAARKALESKLDQATSQ